MNVKTFDVVEMVAMEAENQFKPLWQIHQKNYAVLQKYCKEIDELIKAFDAQSVEVQVDEITMKLSITLSCKPEFLLPENSNFYLLAKRAERVSFFITEDDQVAIKFVFPSIWRRAK